MSWMIADPKRLLDHRSHPLSGPDLSTETERFGSFAQQGGQLGSLLWTQLGRCPRSWLMPQSFRSLCFGILSPLAHCALAYSEGCGDVFLFPSLFMQFPGTHPSSFAPIFEECRFLAHPSFYRHSTFFLYFSPLRSIGTTYESIHRLVKREGIDLRPSIQRLTSAQQQEALASLNAGVPLRKVAKQFEVNHESLRKFAKREGIGLQPWGQRLTPTEQTLTPEQQEEILTLLGAGTSLRRVAKQFDMSRESLRRLVNELKGER